MSTNLLTHASHNDIPSENGSLSNHLPSPSSSSSSKSKIRKLASMASFTRPLNLFSRRRTSNTLTSSTSIASLQSRSSIPTPVLVRSTTYLGPLATTSQKDSYRPSNLSDSSSVTSLVKPKADNENTPFNASRHEGDLGKMFETPRAAPRPRQLTTLEQQRWVGPSEEEVEEEITPTKSSRLVSCPLRRVLKEAHVPKEYQSSSRITASQRRHTPIKILQPATPRKPSQARTLTTFEHQRYVPAPVRKKLLKTPKRDGAVRIQQRQLMQPLPAPLPKSQTTSVLLNGGGELAIDPLRSNPFAERATEKPKSSMNSHSSIDDSGKRIPSAFLSRPTARVRDQSEPILHGSPSTSGLGEQHTSPLRDRSSLGGPQELTTSSYQTLNTHIGLSRPSVSEFEQKKPSLTRSKFSLSGAEEKQALALVTRPSVGENEEHIPTALENRPSPGGFEPLRTPRKSVARPLVEGGTPTNRRQRRGHSITSEIDLSPSWTPSHRVITEAKSSAYWCGRFTTLNDRFRNEEFDVEARYVAGNDETDKYALSMDEWRIRRVFVHLASLCMTDEAKTSLTNFQERYAIQNKLPAAAPVGASLKEKASFFDTIAGKRDGKESGKGSVGKNK